MGNKFILRKHKLFSVGVVALALCLFSLIAISNVNACMVGCADGTVTEDGRPLIWKLLNLVEGGHNIKQLYYVDSAPLNYIVLSYDNANSPAGYTIGLNEAGVSIVYAINNWDEKKDPITKLGPLGHFAKAYPKDPITHEFTKAGYGDLQKHIIGNFKTISEVEAYLEKSYKAKSYLNATGLYSVIDGLGNVLTFEATDTEYKLYYPSGNGSERYLQALPNFDKNPDHNLSGSIVRSNRLHWKLTSRDRLSFKGGRFETGAYNLLGMIWDASSQKPSALQLLQGDGQTNMGYEFLRYGNWTIDPDSQRDKKTLALNSTNAGMIVHGVKNDEDPLLSTLWLIIGHTNYGIAVPAWVTVKDIPSEIHSANMSKLIWRLQEVSEVFSPLIQEDLKIKYNKYEKMIQDAIFPLEKHIYNEVNDKLMANWRLEGSSVSVINQMKRVEHQIAKDAYSALNWFKIKYDEQGINCKPSSKIEQKKKCTVLSNVNSAAIFTLNEVSKEGNEVVFDATFTKPTQGSIDPARLNWDCGDNGNTKPTTYKLSATCNYNKPGKFLVSCTYTDKDALSPISNTAWIYTNTKNLIEQWDFNDRVYENGFKSSLNSGTMLLKNNNTITSTDFNTVSEYDKAAIVNKGDLLEYTITNKLTTSLQWSLLMDVYYDADAPNSELKRALFQTDKVNSGAAECWISRQKHLGSSKTGYSGDPLGKINPEVWNRILFTVDLIGGTYKIYLNGTLILTKTVDANSSLYSDLTLDTKLFFFTDGLDAKFSADNPIKVSKIAFFDGALTSEEAGALGFCK